MAQISTPPLVSALRPEKMTYEQFLELGDGTHAEWVDGKVVAMPPVSDLHDATTVFLLSALNLFVQAKGLGRVLHEPFQMKLGPDLPGRSPDVQFVSNFSLQRLQSCYLDGPADMAIEVISPESRARDRGEKFYEYEQAGVREYWLIDAQRRQAEFYLLDDTGIYQSLRTPDGVFRSQVLPGLWVRIDWLWERPALMDVLKEWQLI
jgi:Uma2 family endonuclease